MDTTAELKINVGTTPTDYVHFEDIPGLVEQVVDSSASSTRTEDIIKTAKKHAGLGLAGSKYAPLLLLLSLNNPVNIVNTPPQYRIDKSTSASQVYSMEKVVDWRTFEPVLVDPLEDQPKYSYSEMIKYAHEMGLSTEFPL